MHDRLVSRRIDALHQCFLVLVCDPEQEVFEMSYGRQCHVFSK